MSQDLWIYGPGALWVCEDDVLALAEAARRWSLTLEHSAARLASIDTTRSVAELHQVWGHWDTELFGHLGDLIELWLSAETRGESVKGSLGVHKTLELALWVVVLNVLFVLLLLLSSLLISFSNGGIHLSLHLSSLLSSFSDGQFCVSHLGGQLDVVHVNWSRSDWQKWLTSWNDKSGVSIISEFLILELNTVVTKSFSELTLKLLSNVRSSNSLNTYLEIELF